MKLKDKIITALMLILLGLMIGLLMNPAVGDHLIVNGSRFYIDSSYGREAQGLIFDSPTTGDPCFGIYNYGVHCDNASVIE